MTKQPVLTGFPHTVFATAKRRAQAVIQSLRQGLGKDSLSGYAVLFQNVLPSGFLEALKPEGRERHYGNTTVFCQIRQA